jgi:hypothetical protein
MTKNYSIIKLYEILFELGKVRHKRDFSRFFMGRGRGYYTMISTGNNRHASIGAIHYLVKRLKHDISCESDADMKRRLTDCLNLADLELAIRLNQLARSARTSQSLSSTAAPVVTCSDGMVG